MRPVSPSKENMSPQKWSCTFTLKMLNILLPHPGKNCFPISNFPYLNKIWRTNSYFSQNFVSIIQKKKTFLQGLTSVF